MPRRFLGAILVILAAAGPTGGAEAVLPVGTAPAPVELPHFPNRLYAFVWRNWQVVEPRKMAEVLGTSVENVAALAESMGLPPATAVPREMASRGYITILRRNWHLLPYEQLLPLVDMSAEQLAYALREDDFLWIKLGLLKPKCEPLRYAAPDAAARRRAAEIKRWVEESFGAELAAPAEPRFDFIRQLSVPTRPAACPAGAESAPLRFIYSYFAVYGDPLLNPRLDPYPDGLLERLSDVGVNGVWLHVVLRSLAPGGKDLPEFGAGHQQRLANLRRLVNRAKRYGIGVYLYMNEPRAMPLGFFKNREQMAGVVEGDWRAMCTSDPAVRAWMADALAYVFRQVPDLAGVFTITASENLTNCASHYSRQNCPRCRNRSNAEIIGEVNATIAAGVHRGNPKAKVIAWDWGWQHFVDGPAKMVAAQPRDAWMMSVSEWDLPIAPGGVKTTIGEYALSAVGPGPRATRFWELSKAAGMKTVAKVQLNNSWELSAVPYLPVMDLVARHCHNLAKLGVDGMMLSWSLGGYPSPNLELASRFSRTPTPEVDEVLDAFARERFGPEGGPFARKAWTAMSRAFSEYPHNYCVLYTSPVQTGPSNLLYATPTGYQATMVGIPYDDLTYWRGPFPAETLIAQFEKMAAGWQGGLIDLHSAVALSPAGRRAANEAEWRLAQAAQLHLQSVANQARFVLLRDRLADARHPLAAADRRRQIDQLRRLVTSEMALARELFTLARLDSRIGFEASNHYFYLPLDLVEKIINCRWILQYSPVLGEQSPSAEASPDQGAMPGNARATPAAAAGL
jgi:hypothetical protein